MCNDNNKIKTTVTIKVSEFYGNNCSGDEYIEVTQEVYDYLISCKKAEKKVEMRIYRHTMPYNFDDAKIGEMCGSVSCSSEDEYLEMIEDERFNNAFNSLSEKHRERLFKRFFLGYSNVAIAKEENVGESAVRRSITVALEKFRKKYCDID